ncbi:hypothetical protein [Acanthopleuribacter pedis]|uniref:Uncharacterized protein n=1 Tax=Acanthopleuribacter pedis TaxID=442870 RepID=A0A8J7U376_9BACT|nr:hypothetical protein [Acanthopleuribacter pedis]MBO1319337.1 hypothetical protein [Acanthopleuribacter pedis]
MFSFRSTAWLFAALLFSCFPPLQADLIQWDSRYFGQGDIQLGSVVDAVGSDDGRFLYILGQDSQRNRLALNVLKYNGPDQQPELVQVLDGNGFVSRMFDLILSPDGYHLYALGTPTSLSGGLTIYVVDKETGKLRLSFHEYHSGYDQIHFVDDDFMLFLVGDVAGIAKRERISGRFTTVQRYRNYYDQPVGMPTLPTIHQIHLLPERDRLIAYHRDDAALSIIQLGEQFAPITATTITLDRRFIEEGNALQFARFSRDGRHVLLTGKQHPTLYELWLDLDRATVADFRRTSLPVGDDLEGNLVQKVAFDEDADRYFAFHGPYMTAVETAFPHGPTRIVAAQSDEPGAGNAASFLWLDQQLVTFPERQNLQVWNNRNEPTAARQLLDFSGGFGWQGFRNPRHIAIAPNGTDMYVSNGEHGLTHFQHNPAGGWFQFRANIQCDQTASAHIFERLLISADGRAMYVQNSATIRHLSRNPANGELALLATHMIGDPQATHVPGASMFLTQNEDALLSIDHHGDLRIFARAEDGTLTEQNQGTASGSGPLAGAHAAALNRDDTLFVLAEDGTVSVFPRDASGRWTQQALFETAPDFLATALAFDDRRGQLWIRGKDGIALYDWVSAQSSLIENTLLADNATYRFGSDGPVLIGENHALIANSRLNTITAVERRDGTWTPTQSVTDVRRRGIRLQGITAMAWHPTEPTVFVPAQEDQTVSFFLDTVLSDAANE